ncbi:MAG: FAD-binding oxidoreductase [Janthinobacterium lividum]
MITTIRPGDTRYEEHQHVYTASGAPAQVLIPTGTSEVPLALAAAREHGGQIAVRSGGHGISSISTNDGGSVIDLRALNQIEHLGGTRVRIGPGARWTHVAHTLRPWGLAISSGDSGDVGVGGLATTGGIGLMGRAHGLTIDRLVAAQVVLADGSIHRATAEEEPDLFWAIRGAGANIGIVTEFEFDASATPTVVRASLAYPSVHVGPFLAAWGEVVEAAPREISAFLYLLGGDAPFAQATVVYAGDDLEAADRAVEPFRRLEGLAQEQFGLVPYAEVLTATGEVHTGQQRAVMRTGLITHLDPPVVGALVTALSSGLDMVQVRSVGGAINDVPSDATAYAHRHQHFCLSAVAMAPGPQFDVAWEPVHKLMDGMYLSFEGNHRREALEEAFPPATLGRLRAIKRRIDPERVFRQNFDVSEPQFAALA